MVEGESPTPCKKGGGIVREGKCSDSVERAPGPVVNNVCFSAEALRSCCAVSCRRTEMWRMSRGTRGRLDVLDV